MKGRFLNLMPGELELGDEWEGHGAFDHLEPFDGPHPAGEHLPRLNCRLVFQDGLFRNWHTDAPIRIYRP
jgi:hypothetical protein